MGEGDSWKRDEGVQGNTLREICVHSGEEEGEGAGESMCSYYVNSKRERAEGEIA